MKRIQLTVEKRKVLGKKVKKLRKEGVLPASIYGKNIKSLAVQVAEKDFNTVYKEAKETGLVDLQVDSEIRPVLIHNVHIDPITRRFLHADFYQVNLKEKIKTMIPVVAVGDPKAVIDRVGLLLQTLSEVEVETLPEDLPEKIEVNVESLTQVDDQLTVANLKVPAGVKILTDPSQIVVKISELVSKEAEELAKAEAEAAEAAKAEAAAETGEAVEVVEEAAPEAPKEEQKAE